MTQYKVGFARFPGSGWEHHACATWMMQTTVKMSRDPAISEVVPMVYCDTPITLTRNAAVKRALAEGCDYLLMIDSDMAPDYLVGRDPFARPFWDTAWNFMLKRREEEQEIRDRISRLESSGYDEDSEDQDIDDAYAEIEAIKDEQRELAKLAPATICAPYCGPPPEECPYIFKWKNSESDSPDPNFRLEMFEREEAAHRAGIEEVAALPTGLILYDTRVFMCLPAPWFRYEFGDIEESIKSTTEDVYQTRNAAALGMPQYVLWDSWAVHVKTKLVGKPRPYTADQVHESLQAAVLRGHKSNERIRMVHRHDA